MRIGPSDQKLLDGLVCVAVTAFIRMWSILFCQKRLLRVGSELSKKCLCVQNDRKNEGVNEVSAPVARITLVYALYLLLNEL